jgi:hypothetical protein
MNSYAICSLFDGTACLTYWQSTPIPLFQYSALLNCFAIHLPSIRISNPPVIDFFYFFRSDFFNLHELAEVAFKLLETPIDGNLVTQSAQYSHIIKVRLLERSRKKVLAGLPCAFENLMYFLGH